MKRLPLFMFFIGFCLIVTCGVDAQQRRGQGVSPPPETLRKYLRMSIEEARQLGEEIIKSGKFPHNRYLPLSFQLPEIPLFARGIKIDGSNYCLFAMAEPSYAYFFPKENLAEFVPAIETSPVIETESGREVVRFFVNGIFFTTVDLQVVELPVLTRRPVPHWIKTHQVIEKGVYVWYLGSVGVFLEKENMHGLLIPFNEPNPNISINFQKDGQRPQAQVELSATSEKIPRILIEVMGRSIKVR